MAMRTKTSLGKRSVIAFVVIVAWFSVSSSRMAAQQGSAGQKAVFNSSQVTGSAVWVDASAWWTGGVPDLCAYIKTNILKSAYGTTGNYPNGTVIDARGLAYGLSSTTSAQIGCSVDPFGALQGPPPSTTILLPSGNIQAEFTWHIPNNTRIVGDEQQTVIIAQSNFSGSYIIEMGGPNASGYDLCPTNGYCNSVGIEHLVLSGNGLLTVGGIDNQNSQGGSYVNDVVLQNFAMTGLSIGAGAVNSGPYSNIVYYASTCTQNSCPTPSCIDLEAQTQGVHGVTCLGNNGTDVINQGAAIIVNASNNSIEDVHVESYWDGIQVGPSPPQNSPVVANVLISNVTGGTTGNNTGGATTNTVHLCGASATQWDSTDFGSCPNHGTLKDIIVLNAMNDEVATQYTPFTIRTTVTDDVSKNAIVGCQASKHAGCPTPISTAVYVLGEADGGPATAYSKFSSSPATPNGNYSFKGSSYVPTWGAGTLAPNALCSPIGAVYSQTHVSGKSVYVCTPQNGGQWATIP
jgi:hypothetical protein